MATGRRARGALSRFPLDSPGVAGSMAFSDTPSPQVHTPTPYYCG